MIPDWDGSGIFSDPTRDASGIQWHGCGEARPCVRAHRTEWTSQYRGKRRIGGGIGAGHGNVRVVLRCPQRSLHGRLSALPCHEDPPSKFRDGITFPGACGPTIGARSGVLTRHRRLHKRRKNESDTLEFDSFSPLNSVRFRLGDDQ